MDKVVSIIVNRKVINVRRCCFCLKEIGADGVFILLKISAKKLTILRIKNKELSNLNS